MKPGDEALVYGPMGSFTIKDASRPVVFLVAGIGITPVLPMLKNLELHDAKQAVHVFYSNRWKKQGAYLDHLEAVSLKNYNLQQIETGVEGRINMNTLSSISNPKQCDYYLIGTTSFLSFMEQLLKEMEVPSSQIFMDDFG